MTAHPPINRLWKGFPTIHPLSTPMGVGQRFSLAGSAANRTLLAWRRAGKHLTDGVGLQEQVPKTTQRGSPARAKAKLAQHTGSIRLTPGIFGYKAEGDWDLQGASGASFAGVGFEPTTFGL